MPIGLILRVLLLSMIAAIALLIPVTLLIVQKLIDLMRCSKSLTLRSAEHLKTSSVIQAIKNS